MSSKMVVVVSMVALAVASTAAAQENATFTLKSGERQSGQLMDLGGVGFTVKIGDQERRIPANDLAVIDFTGGGTSQSDWDRLSSGQFAVLKDGQIVTGQLTDIGGSSPLRLSFSVNGANRDIQSNAVARIVLARPNDVPATSTPSTGGATGTTSGIMVPARQRWTATGLTVRRGETLTVSATGEIRFAANADSKASANGSGERAPDNPLPNATTGALIGRVGDGQAFAVGSQTSFQAPAAGQLFLGVNDTNLDDNDGSFQVQVQRTAVRSRR
jgi:hypothetical protein